MLAKQGTQYVDLVISEGKPAKMKALRGEYRICTLTKTARGQRYINLKLPEAIQDTILSAYEQGKTVRIFA